MMNWSVAGRPWPPNATGQLRPSQPSAPSWRTMRRNSGLPSPGAAELVADLRGEQFREIGAESLAQCLLVRRLGEVHAAECQFLTVRQKPRGRILTGFLQGKVVAITGAGRGIGRCVALDCAARRRQRGGGRLRRGHGRHRSIQRRSPTMSWPRSTALGGRGRRSAPATSSTDGRRRGDRRGRDGHLGPPRRRRLRRRHPARADAVQHERGRVRRRRPRPPQGHLHRLSRRRPR